MLALSLSDNRTAVAPTQDVTYSLLATNSASTTITSAQVTDSFPTAALAQCVWTCQGTNGATCTPGPRSGDISDTVRLPGSSSVRYTATCRVRASAYGQTGQLTNSATIQAAGQPVVSAQDVDTVFSKGDLNADGHADLLLRNENTGALSVWMMGGADQRLSTATPAPSTPASLDWLPVGIDDFNADQKSDFLFWNESTGTSNSGY